MPKTDCPISCVIDCLITSAVVLSSFPSFTLSADRISFASVADCPSHITVCARSVMISTCLLLTLSWRGRKLLRLEASPVVLSSFPSFTLSTDRISFASGAYSPSHITVYTFSDDFNVFTINSFVAGDFDRRFSSLSGLKVENSCGSLFDSIPCRTIVIPILQPVH
ncbi:hypothetical protein BaRGS_00010059 [Batillaria attramentaria]|uniref:Uncharacterized protein n=1 Tax=Batillaria attramentaria TaxID=370345 RepID=A0ABD0LH47_9CAEN